MAKSTLYHIYADLVNAVKDIVGIQYVFLKDRPNVKNGNTPMSRFIVIDLPTSINDAVIGNRKMLLNTSGTFYAFTQARGNGTLDVNTTGELVDAIQALFPISGEYVVATNPAVRMQGFDGDGFQVTMITFDLRCRWGAFENKT